MSCWNPHLKELTYIYLVFLDNIMHPGLVSNECNHKKIQETGKSRGHMFWSSVHNRSSYTGMFTVMSIHALLVSKDGDPTTSLDPHFNI